MIRSTIAVVLVGWLQRLTPDHDIEVHRAIGALVAAMLKREHIEAARSAAKDR
jgi:hypothetical protein